MSLVLWFAGLIGLVIAAGVASGRGQATPNDVFGRGAFASRGGAAAEPVRPGRSATLTRRI